MNKLVMKIFKAFIIPVVIIFLIAACTETKSEPVGANETIIQLVNDTTQKRSRTEIDGFIDMAMDTLEIPGISMAVINNGKVVYHRASGIANRETGQKVNDSSIFEAASISKSVFAYFTLKMHEKSIIDIERPLSLMLEDPDFKEFPETKWVTAEMALSHKTGFPNWRWFSEVPDSLNGEKGEFFMAKKPGEFNYSGEAYQYLARVLANNNFMNMNELAGLVDKEVFEPLNMKHSYFVWDDYLYEHKVWGHMEGKQDGREWSSGLPNITSKTIGAAGSLQTEAMDFSKFIIALLNEKGLEKNTFENMFAEHTPIPETNKFYTDFNVKAWGLGLEIREIDDQLYYGHGGNNGGFTSYFLMNRKNKNAYVFFINNEQGHALNKMFIDYFIR
ncbi:serine hydrolase [Gramella sp. KN1008]|uniref:serine hydrolase domain-containing protein n=1 Tax=Gramella sp. KN1008 TaxID=2529298 RepID=UPI00104098F8|nr:serine hydrolase [Gramella sp. KN1008]TBW25883.1 class C beta-lactamase-related serine hydrolase [Gramella sp. KN1008]